MKLIPTLAALGALVLTSALSAETFEGKVTLKITASNSKDNGQAIEMSLKEGFVRTDIATQKGAASMIMDLKNHQMIILMAAQRMYMVRDIPQPNLSQGQTPSSAPSN